MKIPLVDLAAQNKKFEKQFLAKLKKVIKNGDFVLGDEVSLFEEEFAQYVGTKYCIGVASGTDAILLSLLALEIGKGNEVIVPAFTFSATVSPILQVGAKPVLVDSYEDNPNMDLDQLEKAITGKTKAIVIVHMYGMPSDMKKIKETATKYNLKIIEDACQAHGSEVDGKKAGSFGDTAAFSFYPSKNLGAFGDAGAVVTNDQKLAEKINVLRNHGQERKYLHKIVGINSRLDTIQAIILRLKLKRLDEMNQQRRKAAEEYKKQLKALPIEIVSRDDIGKTNYHLFVIKTDKRDELLNFLKSKGIQCGIHYPYPIHLNPAFMSLRTSGETYTNVEKFSGECLSLPMYPELNAEQISQISGEIKRFFS